MSMHALAVEAVRRKLARRTHRDEVLRSTAEFRRRDDLTMRIATWNLEWAKPRTLRHDSALVQLDSVEADVIVTTEDSIHEWAPYPHQIDAGPDWGYPSPEGRRKVIAWSKSPWFDIETYDDGALRGRLVAATTNVHGIDLRMIAVCIPWRDAHVRTGKRNREIWDEHLEFCGRLGEIVDEVEGPSVVAGDFNQRAPRRRQPQHVFDSLNAALGDVTIDTAGEFGLGRLIDHLASSEQLAATAVAPWPNVIDGRRISDHSGVVVDYELRRTN